MAMYSIRSERAFCERLNYDLLFKWFLDLRIDEQAFDATTFSKNRNACWITRSRTSSSPRWSRQAKLRRYVSSDHFSVDGTLLEAWASHKSFKPKDGPPAPPPAGRNAEVELPWADAARTRRMRRRPIPRRGMYRKSNNDRGEALLRGASVDGAPQRVARRHRAHRSDRLRGTGHRARDARPAPAHRTATDRRRRQGLRHQRTSSPMSASSGSRRTSRRTRPGNAPRSTGAPPDTPDMRSSQRIRKRIEEPFGWIKTIAGGRKLRYIGRATQPSLVPHDRRRLQHHPHHRPRRHTSLNDDVEPTITSTRTPQHDPASTQSSEITARSRADFQHPANRRSSQLKNRSTR